MIRSQLNMEYFHDLYDKAESFDIGIEAHRRSLHHALFPAQTCADLDACRY